MRGRDGGIDRASVHMTMMSHRVFDEQPMKSKARNSLNPLNILVHQKVCFCHT